MVVGPVDFPVWQAGFIGHLPDRQAWSNIFMARLTTWLNFRPVQNRFGQVELKCRLHNGQDEILIFVKAWLGMVHYLIIGKKLGRTLYSGQKDKTLHCWDFSCYLSQMFWTILLLWEAQITTHRLGCTYMPVQLNYLHCTDTSLQAGPLRDQILCLCKRGFFPRESWHDICHLRGEQARQKIVLA